MSERPSHLDVVDPLYDLIRTATPVTDTDLSTPAIKGALGQMAAEVANTTTTVDAVPAGRRWQRRIAGVTAGTALMIVCVTGAAAATGIGLWTGWFDSPTSTESIHFEAYLNTSSPEFATAFDHATAAYPLPPGQTYDRTRRSLLGSGVLKQVTGLRGELALSSSCPWSAAWLAADRLQDVARQGAATSALARIATSPDVAAVDGGGIVDAAKQTAAAAAAGDAAALKKLRSAQGCESDQ